MPLPPLWPTDGATIVFNDIKQELVDKGLAAYKEAGIEAHGYVCDVTNEDAVNAMVKKITEEVGHINILVNNAGIIKRIPMTEMTAAQFRQVIDVDLNAPFIVAKAVIPDMIEQGGGKIINICSMMSELGRETVSAYAAAKGGLKMLTKNIASEYGEYNIQCNGIGPGYIATPQTAPLREIQPDGSRHPFDQFIVAKTPAEPLGRGRGSGRPRCLPGLRGFRLRQRPDPLRRRRHPGLHRQAARLTFSYFLREESKQRSFQTIKRTSARERADVLFCFSCTVGAGHARLGSVW